MNNSDQLNQTIETKEYEQLAKKHRPRRKTLLNSLKAFFVGGTICILGQAIQLFYLKVAGVPKTLAGDTTVATLIIVACLLTGFGVYDRIAQWSGAGTAVPVTGFANAVASAALEHQAEGYVLGVGGNMFKLAGSVIVAGVVSAFFIGLIHTGLLMILR
jgi:stage V sporulation protein AC